MMASTKQRRIRILAYSLRATIVGLGLAIAFVFLDATTLVQAQTFSVLHSFTGGQDGANPSAGLTMDGTGNLYGTTYDGGNGYGTAFKLRYSGSTWILNPLYSFRGGNDGANPEARVVFGTNGALYGTTVSGGSNSNGTVFKLTVPPSVCKTALCPWSETVLYRFAGGNDGANPQYGDLVFDQAGKLYGTTVNGGSNNVGTVYELTPSGGGWAERVIHTFNYSENDGFRPFSGVMLDRTGALYGTTAFGGGPNNFGTVFQLTRSGSNWVENILYAFQGGTDGMLPEGGLILDASGNVYGTTEQGGSGGAGTVFELMPSGGSWTFSLLHSFSGYFPGPLGSLTMDAVGNLYGTTASSGAHGPNGSVFKLTYSRGLWSYTSLYDFTGGADGGFPIGNVIIDGNGNLYGTAAYGGSLTGNCYPNGCGVVWEITP